MERQRDEGTFPTALFALYVLFYSGQAIYNTYLNLYLSSAGLSDTQIGMTVSISTVVLLAAQLGWGMLSDRLRRKNTVLMILYLCMALTSMLFYVNTSFVFLLIAVTLFAAFINPLMPLQDNCTLELLEGSRWDYGQIRMGGTIGYSITVLTIGVVIQDNYRAIFWMVALCMTGCMLVCRTLPTVPGYRNQQKKMPLRTLLNNRALIGLILFNLAFNCGLNIFYNFYPIYFTSAAVGGNSSLVGAMMFACSVSEIPVLFFIHRIVDRLGMRKTLLLAALTTVLRWLLLSALHHPALIIATNLLHGFGYTAFSYCIITFIGKTVPREMRATGQTMNAVIGNVISKVVFGMLGGTASDWIGIDHVMLFCAILLAVTAVVFARWSSRQVILESRGS